MNKTDIDKTNKSRRISGDIESESIARARKYLESYRHGCKMLFADKYASEYFLPRTERDADEKRADRLDLELTKARLCSVRSFVSSLDCDDDVKALLYYHYIRDIPVAECAEMLNVSRAGGFRLRRRALEAAARALDKKTE